MIFVIKFFDMLNCSFALNEKTCILDIHTKSWHISYFPCTINVCAMLSPYFSDLFSLQVEVRGVDTRDETKNSCLAQKSFLKKNIACKYGQVPLLLMGRIISYVH